MVTVFNRKELIITTNTSCQADIRNTLSANHIDYRIKTINLQSASAFGGSRGRVGTFGVNMDYSFEYKIYVHKDDFELARRLIG